MPGCFNFKMIILKIICFNLLELLPLMEEAELWPLPLLLLNNETVGKGTDPIMEDPTRKI